MKAEYRNAIRSKIMIREAFIELLNKKPANKITVTDVIKTANISRGTFYAHYRDIFDLLESFQRDFLDMITRFINKNKEEKLADRIDLLLYKTFRTLQDDFETYKVLANQDFTFHFYQDIMRVLIIELVKDYDLSDEEKRRLTIYVAGFIMMLREWLENTDFKSMEDYIHTLSLLVHEGIQK